MPFEKEKPAGGVTDSPGESVVFRVDQKWVQIRERREAGFPAPLQIFVFFGVFGGRSRTRTYDPLIKSQLLYHLSYAPVPSRSGEGPLAVSRAPL
jgi:hypothetical protein